MGFIAPTPTPTTAYDLIDKDYAKRIIGGFTPGSVGYNAQDTLIGDLISAASLVCAGDRSFQYQQYTEIRNGNSAINCFFVENPPIDANMAVQIWAGRNTDYEFDDDHLLTNHQDYEILHSQGKIEFHAKLSDGIQNYALKYYGGFQSGQIPQDLQKACAMIVADMYKFPDERKAGLLSKSKDGWTTSYTQDEIPPRALWILRKYWHNISA